jgi:hypothetical protein
VTLEQVEYCFRQFEKQNITGYLQERAFKCLFQTDEITFSQYLDGVSFWRKAGLKERASILFRMLDYNNDGEICPSDLTLVLQDHYEFQLGDKVRIRYQDRKGVLKYFGTTEFAEGLWVGIELDVPNSGRNNGSVKNREYFTTSDNRGVFVEAKFLELQKHHETAVEITKGRINNEMFLERIKEFSDIITKEPLPL